MRASLDQSDVDRIADAVAERLASQVSAPAGKLLYSEAEAADRLGVSAHWLKRLRQSGQVVPHRGKRPILYGLVDLQRVKEYLAQ